VRHTRAGLSVHLILYLFVLFVIQACALYDLMCQIF